jgi:hypothetical protein
MARRYVARPTNWEGFNVMTSPSAETVAEFLRLREQMASILGMPTVDMLIDRSATEIRAAHPLVRAISVEDGELNLESLDFAFSGASPEEARAAANALTGVMLLVLARLLGRRVAHSLAEQLDKTHLIESVHL